MISRTFDLLDRYASHFMHDNVLNGKVNGKWKGYSAKEYIDLSHAFAYGLMALDIKKGDKIISISNNRPEWNFADMGMAMCGIIHVPVFPSLNTEEYKFIIKHSDVKLLIISDRSIFNKIEGIVNKERTSVINVYSFDHLEGVKNWKEIVELGNSRKDEFREKLEDIKTGINEEDFASLIYTSGTTGPPKGVMLSHKNMIKNALAAAEVFGLGPDDKYLSILPLCHVGGRMGNYQTHYSGSRIYYVENKRNKKINIFLGCTPGFTL